MALTQEPEVIRTQSPLQITWKGSNIDNVWRPLMLVLRHASMSHVHICGWIA